MASRNFRKDAIDGDRELSRKQNRWRRKGQRGQNCGEAKAAGRSYWRRESQRGHNYRRREGRGTQLLAARELVERRGPQSRPLDASRAALSRPSQYLGRRPAAPSKRFAAGL